MKATNNKINLSSLEQWIKDEEVVFASSTRERKRLVSSLNGELKVISSGSVVYSGTDASLAVEIYNSITEKYIDSTKNFIL